MNFTRIFPWCSAAVLLLCASLNASAQQGATPAAPRPLATPKDMISYSVGVDIVRNFRKQEVDYDVDMLIRGLKDAAGDGKLALNEKEVRRVLNGFQVEVRRKMALNRKVAADDNRRRGNAFLEENKAKPGVQTLASGVQYRVIKQGDGRKPTDADTIECNYRGTVLSGVEFDATEEGKPARLQMSQLINGWRDALRIMPVGSKWQIFIPHTLAYAERGVGSDIGPNETLVFEVELLGIK
jgi:FKBP-type peptidyl-prolyl cis-trans isomerase FklB